MLVAKGITVYRGDEPLFENISLSLSAGEVLQIQGSNGSGKTTLLKVLCGLILADDGVISWHGKDIGRLRNLFREQTLYLGHKPGIKFELTPVENLRVFSAVTDGAVDEAIERALGKMQLSHRMHLPCSVLSAGQRRRVALARLLLGDARLWVLDEPLTALDNDGREFVVHLIESHVQAGGSCLYTTHQALPWSGIVHRSLRLGS